ncbi:MAG: hypothetical protein CFE21_17475 [Bacteroidetes bacterium B1(2017)]|nr:MAG: hypothetical protein CFE21_17475 [Bacteroidetes bacterium B1(2017)]
MSLNKLETRPKPSHLIQPNHTQSSGGGVVSDSLVAKRNNDMMLSRHFGGARKADFGAGGRN